MVTCGQHVAISCLKRDIITGFAKFINAKFRHRRRGTLPKRSQKAAGFGWLDNYEIWKNPPGPMLSTVSCCCLVVVELKNHFG